jgi:hypothetical protein
MARDDERALARALTPIAVRDYALARGWRTDDRAKGRIWLLSHPTDPLRQLLVPKDTHDPGFETGMLDVASRLAELERRSLDAVLADLGSADADVLRVRVVSRVAERGEVSLATDVALREGARRALLASACSVISPRPYHPRMTKGQAEALLAACRAGQTEVGSYVIRVICPLHATSQQSLEELPFTRQVTTSLMRTVRELVASIEAGTLDGYVDAISDHPGVSANLCEALVEMQPALDEATTERVPGELELTATWAADPRVRAPTEEEAPSRVVVKSEYMREIERAAQRLRPGSGDSRVAWYIATVERLDGTVGDDGRRSGDVRLSVLVPDGETQLARASLGPDDYAIAVEAHEQGRAYVYIHASLRRSSPWWKSDRACGNHARRQPRPVRRRPPRPPRPTATQCS